MAFHLRGFKTLKSEGLSVSFKWQLTRRKHIENRVNINSCFLMSHAGVTAEQIYSMRFSFRTELITIYLFFQQHHWSATVFRMT